MTAMQRIELVDRIDAERKARLLVDLEGLSETTRMRELREFDKGRQDPSVLLTYALSIKGATELQEFAGREVTIDQAGYEAACDVVGIDLEALTTSTAPTEDPTSSPKGKPDSG